MALQTSQRNWNKNARSNVNYQDNMLFDLKKDGAKELLTDIDCVPIFSTIPTINIRNWNTIRYQQGKTGYLKYERIPQMQSTGD